MAAQDRHFLRRRQGAEDAGQRPRAELGRRTVRQQPAPVAIDVDEEGLEPLAVDGAQHRVGRCDADLVLGGAPAGEDADADAWRRSCAHQAAGWGRPAPRAPQSPTNSISYWSSTPCAVGHGGAHVVADRAHVGGRSPAVDDDEVGVHGADLRRSDAEALQPGGVDQPARMVVGRIAKDAARVLIGERLRRLALRLVGGDPRRDLAGIAGGQLDGTPRARSRRSP